MIFGVFSTASEHAINVEGNATRKASGSLVSGLYSFAAKLRWRYIVPKVRVKDGAVNHAPSMRGINMRACCN